MDVFAASTVSPEDEDAAATLLALRGRCSVSNLAVSSPTIPTSPSAHSICFAESPEPIVQEPIDCAEIQWEHPECTMDLPEDKALSEYVEELKTKGVEPMNDISFSEKSKSRENSISAQRKLKKRKLSLPEPETSHSPVADVPSEFSCPEHASPLPEPARNPFYTVDENFCRSWRLISVYYLLCALLKGTREADGVQTPPPKFESSAFRNVYMAPIPRYLQLLHEMTAQNRYIVPQSATMLECIFAELILGMYKAKSIPVMQLNGPEAISTALANLFQQPLLAVQGMSLRSLSPSDRLSLLGKMIANRMRYLTDDEKYCFSSVVRKVLCPLGFDRFGHSYWLLDGMYNLY